MLRLRMSANNVGSLLNWQLLMPSSCSCGPGANTANAASLIGLLSMRRIFNGCDLVTTDGKDRNWLYDMSSSTSFGAFARLSGSVDNQLISAWIVWRCFKRLRQSGSST